MEFNQIKQIVGVCSLALISVIGLRDSGIFVTDHTTTLNSGADLSFEIEEEANIIGYRDNGYLVQKDNAKVTVPREKILITEGPVQKYVIKENTSLRKDGKVLRNLFLGETLTTVEAKTDTMIVTTTDGQQGEVNIEALEPVEGPYITNAIATESLVLENDNGEFEIEEGQVLDVVSFQDGLFIIIDEDGKDFAIDQNYLDFNGVLEPKVATLSQEEAPEDITVDSIPAPTADSDKVQYVLDSAFSKIGTPYVWGGTSSSGYDCSGLVYAIYYNELGIVLPRTSSAQSQYGTQIARADLQPGDLVFFNTCGNGVSHVGIYIGDGEFIHAASGAGHVKINSLDQNYYNTRYVNATRVL